MAKYINKDCVVAEIEKVIADETESIKTFEHGRNISEVQRSNARIDVLMYISSLLDTLEVKEVDYDKEVTEYLNNFKNANIGHRLSLRRCAKYFFELGMSVNIKAQKE